MKSVALTDHGRAGGLLQFKKACEKHNIKPIYGVELYMCPPCSSRTVHEKIDGYKTSYHIVVLAKNEEGLKNIFKLTSIGWLDGFYYKPRVDVESLRECSEGIIVLSGCAGGFISNMLMEEREEEAIEFGETMKGIFGEDFYVEVQDHGIDWQTPLKHKLFEFAKNNNIETVATQDSHFIEKEDSDLHAKICRIAAGDLEFDSKELYFKSYDEMRVRMDSEDEKIALQNTHKVADKCNVDWKFGETIWPVFKLPTQTNPEEELQRKTTKGFEDILKSTCESNGTTNKYKERIQYELSVIKEMGFATYFLVVADFIEWAKEKDISVGPGRGCLTGETSVYTSSGRTVNLNTVKPGDFVISHTGETRKVVNTFEYNVEETLLNIKTIYGDYNGITMTKDHKVFGEKTELVDEWVDWSEKTKSSRRKYKESTSSVCEIPAEELEKGDFVFFPKIKRNIDDVDSVSMKPYMSLSEYPCKQKKGFIEEYVPSNRSFIGSVRDINKNTKVSRGCIKSFRDNEYDILSTNQKKAYKKIEKYILKKYNSIDQWRKEYKVNRINKTIVKTDIVLDNEFMWVLGKWVADGWLKRGNKRVWGVCFNSNEISQIEKVELWLNKNALRYKKYKHATKKLIQIEVRSGIFTTWWKMLFKGYCFSSHTKHFPRFIKSISDEKLTYLIKGYIDGDGHVSKGKIKATTTSRTLAHELKYMLLSLNIPSSIIKEKRKELREEFENARKVYCVSFPVIDSFAKFWPEYKTEKEYRYKRTNEGIFCRIRNIEEIKDVKKVYDITVEEDHSYLTTSGAVHNSAAGSLVCYCIGITDVDPIKYELYFERFLNPARISLPDIDVDFCPKGRKQVMSYVSEKYGSSKVAQIGTYAAFKPRGSLRDFARACGYKPRIGDMLANMIPPDVAGFQSSFDKVIEEKPEILKTEQPEVVNFARRAEGLKTKMGVHAAGVVISDRNIEEQLPLFRGKHNEIATQFDMHNVEELGLVKYDFLGLINLTIIQDTITMVNNKRGANLDNFLTQAGDGDEEVFKNIFQTGDLDGVFQFETSSGFKDLCVKVKPTSIDDLSDITALFRPGPLDTGLVDKYVSGRRGGSVEYATPELEPILGETYGVMVYQEQIMKICVDLAGYTASKADDMRKAIGKKDKERMARHEKLFVEGCVKNDIKEEIAIKMFDDIKGFAKYSFNKAHSVAYSIISYRTAWLKHYYTEEFYCALFNNTISEKDQLVKYIHSCREREIPIEPPDINRSAGHFTVDQGTIMFGLAGIKGVGQKACDHLLEIRPREGFVNLKELIDGKVNASTLKSLAASGSLETILTNGKKMTTNQLIETIPALIKYYKSLDKYKEREKRYDKREQEKKECVEQGKKPPRSLPKLPPPPEQPIFDTNEESSGSQQKQEKLKMERETLGFYISGHPLDDFPGLHEKSSYTIEKIREIGKPGTIIKIPIVISSLVKKRTKRGQDMGITIVEDRTGRMEATIFPNMWKKIKDKIEIDKVAIATCKIDRFMLSENEAGLVKLIMYDVEVLTEEEKKTLQKPVITNIIIKLKDGANVTFHPGKDTKLELWQKAKAIATNLERNL